ncbi:MAG: YozQ family protein [Alicyclobacillus herbarius]|uniref:YozQ family protein n=1 Tax=Alicyclobacillus herbarius TaxID=122960 RepID=UPI00041B159C|nr:YozQ family protein [Alicyclobacillus herbarius]MCL6634033.1 YozQ family protein [Alicyclobacillus herbarius]
MACNDRPLPETNRTPFDVRDTVPEYNGLLHLDDGLAVIQQQLRDAYTSGTSDEFTSGRTVTEMDIE